MEIAHKLGYKTTSFSILDLIKKRISELKLDFVTDFNYSNIKNVLYAVMIFI